MEFEEAEEIRALRDVVRRFIARECPSELSAKWDREDYVPRDMLLRLAELGLCALCVPEDFGGMGRQVMAMTVAMEELARCNVGLANLYNMNANYGALCLSTSGTDEQKARLLPDILAGKIAVAYGLSEPDVGADLANVRTTAKRNGGVVVVNGSKRWTSGADIADYINALVRTGPAEERRKNLSFIYIPAKAKGVTVTRLSAMGSNGTALNDVHFDNVEVPVENVIGPWNGAWSLLAGPSLESEKLAPPAIALGVAEAALAEAWDYSQQRVQGGKRICGHQAVRHVLADAQTKLQACRLMMRHAAWLVERKEPSAVATSMAKVFVSENAKEIVLSCQQYVMGAYGYARGLNMERHVRDILAVPIYGGSTAIQRNNIANLLKLPRE